MLEHLLLDAILLFWENVNLYAVGDTATADIKVLWNLGSFRMFKMGSPLELVITFEIYRKNDKIDKWT